MPALISPAFTPPSTPGSATPLHEKEPRSIPVFPSSSTEPLSDPATQPKLVEKLPRIRCEVRARIPTTTGTEMWLYLYSNEEDRKEHLAIVFGDRIRSRSLDEPRPGESERDRMIRGAYVGRLYPGRTSSRVEELKRESRADNSSKGNVNDVVPGAAEDCAEGEEEMKAKKEDKPPLARIHSECYTGETVWSARCDCGEQLDEAARLMSLPSNRHSGGVIIYLRQEGRGIGLLAKLQAYNLQDLGHDTYEANLLLRHPADARSYGLATAMLVDLGLGGERGIRLLTNNPDKVRAVEGPNREVVVRERVPMVPLAWRTGGKSGVRSPEVEKYLSTKVSFLYLRSTNNSNTFDR
jgi:GTP cyclohydrolase II